MTTVIRCRVGDVVRRGTAITIEQTIDPARLAATVRGDSDVADEHLSIVAPDPTPVHEHVGCLAPGMGVRARTALARAGRSRGLDTPYDDELAAVRDRLSADSVENRSLSSLRERLARRRTETERLRERVATARGRVRASRDEGGDVSAAETALESAIRELSEAETTRAAVEQRLERARETARDRRAQLERERQLEDRLANLERQARQHLVSKLRGEYLDAISALPGTANPTDTDPFDIDSLTAAFAIARVASLSGPVVVACDRFRSASDAADWLDAPVLRVNSPQE